MQPELDIVEPPVTRRIVPTFLSSDVFAPTQLGRLTSTNHGGHYQIPGEPPAGKHWGTHPALYGGIGRAAYTGKYRRRDINIARPSDHFHGGILNCDWRNQSYYIINPYKRSECRMNDQIMPAVIQVHLNSPLGLPLSHRKFDSYLNKKPEPPLPPLPPCCERRNLPKTPCEESLHPQPPLQGDVDGDLPFDDCRCLIERHPIDRWRCEASSRGLEGWRQYYLRDPLNVYPHLFQDRRYVPTEKARF
ncbi:hypothetical protein LSAT2_008741 [Lamellibrachia satsuma]|nr:hypothetical protein LSAT2_008741 [Lamellibrachia satsuma]